MSIYLVDFKNDKFWRKKLTGGLRWWIKRSKCKKCGRKMYKGSALWAYHSLPFGGGGWEDWWCSDRCLGY